jgi:hypothetical protein
MTGGSSSSGQEREARLWLEIVLGKSGNTWLSSEKKSESASGPGLAGAGLVGLGRSALETVLPADRLGGADGRDGGAAGLGGGFFAGAPVTLTVS